MNKRIVELLKQVGGIQYDEDGDELTPILVGKDLAKFAESIVQECISVVEGGSFLHNQAPTAIFARECSGAIKQHFGVEL